MRGHPLPLTLRRGAIAASEGHSAGLKGVPLWDHYTRGECKVSKFRRLQSNGKDRSKGKIKSPTFAKGRQIWATGEWVR